MMTGPILNSCSIILGGILGSSLSRYIPKRLQEGMPAIFALACIAIGINMIVKVNNLPVVVMSLMIGTVIGESCYLESGVSNAANFIQSKLKRLLPLPRGLTKEEFSQQFTALIVLFGASGLGVIGAMTEGLNGNYQLLLVKSLMDLPTAMIFAITLGPGVVLLAVVQFVVQSLLFILASFIMPYMDSLAYADFSAVGGIIMLAVGLRISKIMHFAVVNFLPALFLVLPFTFVWRHFFPS